MLAQAAPAKGKGNRLPKEKAFAAETSERTGQDKATINRHVSRAEALGDGLVGKAFKYRESEGFDSSA